MRIGKRCTGCRACEQICPKNAISMTENRTGFLEPHIDEAVCVGCGLCEKTCHLLDHKGLLFRKPNLFVAGAKNKNAEERYASTSGGIFSLLAAQVIAEGGAVYGATFDGNFAVRHTRAVSVPEIAALMGSKYVQSDTNRTFSDAAKDLQNGRTVLFSGTPCQIAAVQSFLAARGTDTSRFITAEVVCHGAPSPLAWREYLSYAQKNICQTIHKVFFRHKIEGWHARSKVRFLGLYSEESDFKPTDASKNKESLVADSSFIKLFLSNLILRDECHRCDYARRERTADITLCDFWGIENTDARSLDDDGGVSGVIVHSEKGLVLWNKIANKCEAQEIGYDIIAQNQQTMNVPFSRPPEKDAFWSDFLQNSWECAKNYIKDEQETEQKMVPQLKIVRGGGY